MRRKYLLFWVLALAVGIVYGLSTREKPAGEEKAPVAVGKVDLGGPFELTDQNGKIVTRRDVADAPYAVFFGFTHCPDVCPTTLYRLTQLLDELGPEGERLKVLFVTVDPERDDVDQMKTYLSSFDPRIIGLTGSQKEIDRMLANFDAVARKVPTGDDYTMDHTAVVFLMGSDGRFATTLDMHEPEEVQLGKLRRLAAR